MKTLEVKNNKFTALGVEQGDTLIFDENSTPENGDLTLLTYNDKQQLVWFLGYDYLDYPILAKEYSSIPIVISIPTKLNLVGKLVKVVKVGEIA